MKKFINGRDKLVEDMLEGFLYANQSEFVRVPGFSAYRKREISDKVCVMSNGGAGCEPMHIAYVGKGMGDATCIGEMYAAPSAFSIYETAKTIDTGKGILLICGNFSGDYLNGDMARELLELDGIRTELVLVRDDILSAPDQPMERGGVAGIIDVLKVAGAASEEGCPLEEVTRLAQKAADNAYTISAILYSGYNPITDVKMFDMPEDSFELGMGFNGEPGEERLPMMHAGEIVERMISYFRKETELCEGTEVSLLVNSMGSTSYMELLILYKELHDRLEKIGVRIFNVKINRYLTSFEMGGCSVTLMKMDDELKHYYNHEASTPVYTHQAVKE